MRGATSHDSRSNYRTDISTHAPHAESDTATITARATKAHFNPHLLCGRRLVSRLDGAMGQNFNPRSPCGERPAARIRATKLQAFQPTLPMRGATVTPLRILTPTKISTHAPHAGSDITYRSTRFLHSTFQPTLPMRGATVAECRRRSLVERFQPTLPMRGATRQTNRRTADTVISTHAPHAGSDTF